MSKYKYFSSCPENGVSFHETQQQALDFANESIRTHLNDGWSEDVECVVVGVITHKATEGERVYREGEVDTEGLDEAGEYWDADIEYKVNYSMQSVFGIAESAIYQAEKV